MTLSADQIYALLPAIYRTRDAAHGLNGRDHLALGDALGEATCIETERGEQR